VGEQRAAPPARPAAGSTETQANPASRSTRIMTRFLAAATFGAAGFLGATSAVSAEGTDLRAERQTDVADLARAQVQRNQALDADRADLREEVNDLLNSQLGGGEADRMQKQAEKLAPSAGLTALSGPGVSVTLDDAPVTSRGKDVDPDALVVHQQDIQGVVNALWAGGAEAMTLQGQRIISTSAVRCVGNTVRINGWVYSPPYHIEAIGDAEGMIEALGESPEVDIYRDYAAKYHLGWSLKNVPNVHVPAFDGPLNLDYAEERSTGQSSDR
jgi:uncharacterized protein YlxW (UPF0749 family)